MSSGNASNLQKQKKSIAKNKISKRPSTSQTRPKLDEKNEENAPNNERKGNKQEVNSHTKRSTPISIRYTHTGEQMVPLAGKEKMYKFNKELFEAHHTEENNEYWNHSNQQNATRQLHRSNRTRDS